MMQIISKQMWTLNARICLGIKGKLWLVTEFNVYVQIQIYQAKRLVCVNLNKWLWFGGGKSGSYSESTQFGLLPLPNRIFSTIFSTHLEDFTI